MIYEVAKESLIKISTDAEAVSRAYDACIQTLVKLAAEFGHKSARARG